MTRLKEEWIRNIEADIVEYEQDLIRKTGLSLLEISGGANGIPVCKIKDAAEKYTVAVIPVTTGEGIIGTFSESVAAIIRYMGFRAFVTDKTDVDGIFRAYELKADCLFLADDNRYIGINLNKNIISDNNRATAAGYITVLEKVCGGLAGKDILLLGYGIVGKIMLDILKEKKAAVRVYDKNSSLLSGLSEDIVLKNPDDISKYPFLLDATNEGGWIKEGMLHKDAWIITPGIPLSLTDDVYNKYKGKVVHDWLQIGTAVMMGELCR